MQSKSGHHQQLALPTLTLLALGVVFGDIGTSPLYAIRQSFIYAHLTITPETVLGILSLIFWSMTMVISIKYVSIIMRADNNGEGGIMALLALNLRIPRLSPKQRAAIVLLGFVGASLFFGDGIITPAISVLSATEGLSLITPVFDRWIVPIAIVILALLFAFQHKGTAKMGKYFAPITVVWFLCIGLLGAISIAKTPFVLTMVSPHWAFQFILHYPALAFLAMGAVVLTITGGEALYADMGHLGAKPIRMAWFFVVLPSLLLNYAGQGALLLRDPLAIENPFYLLVPEWLLMPMILLATAAAIIASQAVITGVFSMVKQAMQLGYLPRLAVRYTSTERGQIYIPFVNWFLFSAVVVLILLFQSSSQLASAYGVAVTMTMLCGTILIAVFAYGIWRWAWWKVALVMAPFLAIELILVASTSLKIPAGGWVPIVIGISACFVMLTWEHGRKLMHHSLERQTLGLDVFVKHLAHSETHQVQGAAVFLTGTPSVVPHALLHNLKHNQVLHQSNYIVTVETKDIPYVEDEYRFTVEEFGDQSRFYRVRLYYGFKDQVNVPLALEKAVSSMGHSFDMMRTSFFISRAHLIHSNTDGKVPWREKIFIAMQRNTSPASDFYHIPTNRVVEMGSQVEI